MFIQFLYSPGSLTVRPWKEAGPQKERLVFQPSFFGGYVSFREGGHPKLPLISWAQTLENPVDNVPWQNSDEYFPTVNQGWTAGHVKLQGCRYRSITIIHHQGAASKVAPWRTKYCLCVRDYQAWYAKRNAYFLWKENKHMQLMHVKHLS